MTPEFLLVSSKGFRIGRKAVSGLYAGLVVASADAFFLVVGQKATHMGMAAGGGVVGELVATVLARRAAGEALCEPATGVIETDLAALPAEVTAHRDWPVKQTSGPVLVIPRAAIQSVRYSFWQWGVFLQTEGLEFRIEPPFFGRERLWQTLGEMGWAIERKK